MVLLSSSFAFAQNKAIIEDLSNTGMSVFTPDENQMKARLAEKSQLNEEMQIKLIEKANAESAKKLSAGKAPVTFLGSPSVNPNLSPKGSTAWGLGLQGGGLVSLDVGAPSTYLTANPAAWSAYAGDYDNESAAVYYIMDSGDGYLKMIYMADGSVAKVIGLPDFSAGSTGFSPSGMACDRNTGIMYLMGIGTTSDLFTIDVTDASTTFIGSSSGFMIDIAIDGDDGIMYAHDLTTNSMFTIDKTTGAATLLGATGFTANYAQGASWDPLGDVVYLAAYNVTTATDGGELRSINTSTGASTLIGGFPGLEEVDAFAFPNNNLPSNNDVLAGTVTTPISWYELTATETVTVTVYNIGSFAESNIPIHYIYDGGTPVNETVPGPIAAGGFVTYSFIAPVDATTFYGTHTLDVYTALVGDDVTANDMIVHQFDNVPDGVAITTYPYLYTFDNAKAGVNNADACTPDGSVLLNLWEYWLNVAGGTEDMDWDVNSGTTPSGTTGPSGDHTGGGQYLFTEASVCYEMLGTVQSPEFDFTALTNPELEFFYHMWGTAMGTMSCDITTDGGSNWTNLWSLSGDQGNSWQQVLIDLIAYTAEPSVYLRWQGLTGTSYSSDMALDDVGVHELPACAEPLDLAVSNILNNQADLSWTDVVATMWDVEIREIADPLTGTATDPGLLLTTFTATGLKELTEHHWQVRADCGGGIYSAWVPGDNFTTLNNGDCVWQICLNDDYGDGWQNGTVDVTVGGVLVLDDITLLDGYGPGCFDFMVTNTSTIDISFTAGLYPEENMYFIYSNYGAQVFLDGTNLTVPSGVTGLAATCDAPPVPANDLCANPESVTGPYPVTVSGTTAGATADVCTIYPVIWYEIELPYDLNYVTVDYCPTADILGSPVWSVLANLYVDCACSGYGNSYLNWYGCNWEFAPYYEFAGIPGPGTILLPVSIADYNGVRQMDFQLDVDVYGMYPLDLTVFLEGPFDSTLLVMDTTLKFNGVLPLEQPYDTLNYYGNPTPDWYYTGTESVAAIPDTTVVDWVLVQLRDAVDAASAVSATIVGTQAVFLLADGSVVYRDGASYPQFVTKPVNNLYGVIYHRNHLGVMSSVPITYDGVSGLFAYDFSIGESQAHNNGHKAIDVTSNVWGMRAADGNGNGFVQLTDKQIVWLDDLGLSGYLGGDFDMNAFGQNSDKQIQWNSNFGAGAQIPLPKGLDYYYKSQIPK